eukprot:CAMPEP_0197635098 /NCGR_PEP_ID=MMETSP1338-20131121/11006_1 /TAXON_ID=43686 ORGANISM="Pelagodinium beii, Strain RCC1491" /NCGR_SAMPLE_ID=MMETSP1338 /ASSEMBLY_ACC=CAM_ASM_000754 /LENGTH=220 /DNA_ID=CAMNT_0043207081 /DNA_START=65 /DNA_END=723 /DNA_ORIENTATION=-
MILRFTVLLCLATVSAAPFAKEAVSAQEIRRHAHGGYSELMQLATLPMKELLERGRQAEQENQKHPPAFHKTGEITFRDGSTGAEKAKTDVEIPMTFSHFMRGLMYRKSMEKDQSMLFRWAGNGRRSFWMENTFVPLDIIYADRDGVIVSIKQANALDTRGVPSSQDAASAIEVNQGWSRANGVTVGDTVKWDVPSDTGFVAMDIQDFGANEDEVRSAIL